MLRILPFFIFVVLTLQAGKYKLLCTFLKKKLILPIMQGKHSHLNPVNKSPSQLLSLFQEYRLCKLVYRIYSLVQMLLQFIKKLVSSAIYSFKIFYLIPDIYPVNISVSFTTENNINGKPL